MGLPVLPNHIVWFLIQVQLMEQTEYGERRQISGSLVYLCEYINERDN